MYAATVFFYRVRMFQLQHSGEIRKFACWLLFFCLNINCIVATSHLLIESFHTDASRNVDIEYYDMSAVNLAGKNLESSTRNRPPTLSPLSFVKNKQYFIEFTLPPVGSRRKKSAMTVKISIVDTTGLTFSSYRVKYQVQAAHTRQ